MILQGLLHSGQFQATSLQLITNFIQVLFGSLTFNTQVGESFQIFGNAIIIEGNALRNIGYDLGSKI
jgi:hypothetical protein